MSEECRAGCCPHGGAGQGPGCPGDLPGAPLGERVVHLRGCQLMPVQQIAALTGADRQFITRLLYQAVPSGGPRGPARRMTARTAEDARLDEVVARMALEDARPATWVAPPSWRGPSEIELLTALYADPEVRRVLDTHGIPVCPTTSSPWQRFPASRPLTADLAGDLYEGCGLGLHHIELLTGRPAAAVGAVLRAGGIKLRPRGGRSPFTDRWRPGRE
ncbi:MAG: hypothetical protein ACRDP7_47790 [Trebonia sp.]